MNAGFVFVGKDVEDAFGTGSAGAGMPGVHSRCRGLSKHQSRPCSVSKVLGMVYPMNGWGGSSYSSLNADFEEGRVSGVLLVRGGGDRGS